jgi:predicted phosphoribosyltransferase
MQFTDRMQAGSLLAEQLGAFARRPEVIVLGLPRGGVPVAFAIAERLRLELDVLLVRKLGVPGHAELAMGAVAGGGLRVVNRDVVERLGIDEQAVEKMTGLERAELQSREGRYRRGAPPPRLEGRIVILVDDGLATGATMRVAIQACRNERPEKVIVAVPVASAEGYREMIGLADEVVCLHVPEVFHAVGIWYEDFSPTEDHEVRRLIARAAQWKDEAEHAYTRSGHGMEP